MPAFETFDGIKLSYDEQGDGPPVVLLHGFAADSYINWVRPGFFDRLSGTGFRAIALDARGHGLSDKPHDPSAYAGDAMARDARALIDHLGLEAPFVVGYSMGAGVALLLLMREPRVRAAVVGGVGQGVLGPRAQNRSAIADVLLASDRSAITDPTARSFRDFADLTRADREALAAIQRANRESVDEAGLARISAPVLVIAGDNDPLAGSPHELAAKIPGARAELVPGTHLNVVNNPLFQQAVIGFLSEQKR